MSSNISNWKNYDVTQTDERLKTFIDWSKTFIKPEDLAELGFYYTGNGSHDTVECFSCGISLGCWEEGDDPKEEHKKASPKCAYVLNPNVQIGGPPLHPEFNNFNARCETFKLLWQNTNQIPSVLAAAGFFYAGESDYTKCYYCGIVLKDWLITDQPWEAHAYFSSDCDYVQMMKGPNFIHNTVSDERKHSDNIEEKKKNVSEEDLCNICCTHETSVVLVPCGHVFCPRCALSIKACSKCRSNVEEIVQYIMM